VRVDQEEPDAVEQRQQRQQKPQEADVVGGRQRALREAAVAQVGEGGVEVLGHLFGEHRRDRLEPEADQLGGVGEVEDEVVLVADEEDAIGLERGAPEEPAEGPGVDHGVHHGLQHRAARNQVRGAPLNEVDDDLAADHLAHVVVFQRRLRPVGEPLRRDHLVARVKSTKPSSSSRDATTARAMLNESLRGALIARSSQLVATPLSHISGLTLNRYRAVRLGSRRTPIESS